jgi:urease accessory protein
MLALIAAALTALRLGAGPALAHVTVGMGSGITDGFLHPLTGLDHLLAMVSVGIWGAELGAPAIWLLPIAFPLIMALGAALGVTGMPLPAGDLIVAVSVVVLGALVALAQRLPLWTALAIVGVFAVAHGHAHGAELPYAADALAFTVGFVLATGMLHLAGIVIGLLAGGLRGAAVIRASGCAIAIAGCYFVYGYAWAA